MKTKLYLTSIAIVLLVAFARGAEPPKLFVAELKPEILKFEPFTWTNAIP